MIFVTFVRKIYCDFFNDCEFVTSSAFGGRTARSNGINELYTNLHTLPTILCVVKTRCAPSSCVVCGCAQY